MCGIAGYVFSDPNRPATSDRLQKMIDVVSHRGPDGEGRFLRGPVALGHRRLAIIDLDTGEQPMTSDSGHLHIVHNGEIYNYLEVRQELESLGHRFRTQSDTEVILEAYQEWGLDGFTRLNGMWALALWDEPRRRLVLSRDRLGEKPLHYAETRDGIAFGSEMKSLFAYGIPREKDLQWLEVFCSLGYLPAPHTFFAGVQKLPPGCSLVIDPGQPAALHRYWDLPEIDEENLFLDREEVEARFASLLEDSVRLRMRSDVPFGAFLSGGLDSSSVVALMSEVQADPVKTFTIGFSQPGYDERDLARAVSKAFHTDHVEQLVEPSVFEDSLAQVLHHYDEPFGDSSAIPTGIVSRLARRSVKMVLTGDGGDEVLSGYTVYQGERFARDFRRLPQPVRQSLPPLIRLLTRGSRGAARQKLNRARDVVESSNQDFLQRLVQKTSWADLPTIRALLQPLGRRVAIEDFLEDRLRACPYRGNFYKLMYFHLKTSLPDDMLVKVDRMSMAHSLEVRTPFLDHRLVEYMVGVDKSLKMRGYQRKVILRDTIGKRLPAALLAAPKKGFAVPIGEWFRGDEFARFAEELVQTNGIPIDPGAMREVVRENANGQEDHGNFLWILMLASRFCRDSG